MLSDIPAFFRVLCQNDPAPGYGPGYGMGYGAYGWTHMMSPMGGGLFMLLLVVLGFVLAARVYRRSSGAAESPLDILKRRYAQGEISREDFERMKQDLKD